MDSRNPKEHEHARRKLHRRETRQSNEGAERDIIKQQLRALRAVIPNSRKPDMVSVLGEAIDYVKFLQSQLHRVDQAILMRNSLQHGAATVGLQSLQHSQFGPVRPLEVPMTLGTYQGMCVGNGSPCMGCYSGVPLLPPSTAHHSLSRASTLPWLQQMPTFPMHVTQLRRPQGPVQPCEFCSVLADARTWPQPVHSLVSDQEAEAEEHTTTTSVSTDIRIQGNLGFHGAARLGLQGDVGNLGLVPDQFAS